VSDLPTVLERLADPEFLDRVVRDPKDALAGYQLTRDDVSVLAARLADEQDVLGFVEQRVAKAGMFALLSSALPPDSEEGGAVPSDDDPAGGDEPGS